MRKSKKLTLASVRVVSWFRMPSSANGNPRFGFSIIDNASEESYNGSTKPDHGFVYGMAAEPHTLLDVELVITPTGRLYMTQALRA